MTAVDEGLVFKTTGRHVDGTEQTGFTPFILDDVTLLARRPKDAQGLYLAQVLASVEDDPAAALGAYTQLMASIFHRDTSARIQDRLKDPDDELDLDDVNGLMTSLMRHWGMLDDDGNPTQPGPTPARAKTSRK